MYDRSSRAARYRELAAEREHLAALATDSNVRAYYQKTAEYYLSLAHAEMKLEMEQLDK
jgi:hypothetical protein